jgi:hypothetical protein
VRVPSDASIAEYRTTVPLGSGQQGGADR